VNSLKMLFRIALVVAASFARASEPATTPSAELVALGKYRVTTSGCHDCHTPMKMTPKGPQPDMDRALSGHPDSIDLPAAPAVAAPWGMVAAATNTAFAGPWGVSFTANLTPDRETGLGKWTLRNFIETIRTGRHLGRGREILPPMPIPMYKHFTDEDLAAIFAYLQTIPAVKNRVPAPRAPEQAAVAAASKPL
jgi:mono/diheme cytochrome c family protein